MTVAVLLPSASPSPAVNSRNGSGNSSHYTIYNILHPVLILDSALLNLLAVKAFPSFIDRQVKTVNASAKYAKPSGHLQ
jgi:hypothetical protein